MWEGTQEMEFKLPNYLLWKELCNFHKGQLRTKMLPCCRLLFCKAFLCFFKSFHEYQVCFHIKVQKWGRIWQYIWLLFLVPSLAQHHLSNVIYCKDCPKIKPSADIMVLSSCAHLGHIAFLLTIALSCKRWVPKESQVSSFSPFHLAPQSVLPANYNNWSLNSSPVKLAGDFLLTAWCLPALGSSTYYRELLVSTLIALFLALANALLCRAVIRLWWSMSLI